MGRFSASGARLHELRQPKPANAAFRQGQPPRSRDFSLGLEHPQRAIPPACWEEPAFGRYRTASRAPSAAGAGAASASSGSPRRPRGALPASSPFRTPPATCPLKRRGAVARDAPLRAARATSPQNSGRHRLVAGNSVGMPALAGLRESGAPRRVPGISAGKPSKEALPRRPIGGTQAKARSVARLRGGFCESRGLASADRGEHAARQRPYRSPPAAALVQKAPKTALGRAAAPTQVHGAQCGTGEAPQERRRGCTRTPRRRRRSGWTRP